MPTTLPIGPLTGNHTGPLGGAGNTVLVYDSGQIDGVFLSASISGSGVAVGYQGSAWDMLVEWFNSANALISQSTLGTHHFDSSPTGTLNAVAPTGTKRATLKTQAALNSPDTAAITVNGSFSVGPTLDSLESDLAGLGGDLEGCCADLDAKLNEILAAVRRTYVDFDA